MRRSRRSRSREIRSFRYLESFLDLEEADEVREAYSARADAYAKAAEKHRQTSASYLRTVLALMPAEHTPSALTWSSIASALTTWASAIGTPCPGPDWKDLFTLAERLRPLLAEDNVARSRLVLTAAKKAWDDVAAMTLPSDPAPLINRRDALMASATDAELALLLDEASKHLAAHTDAASCPVCEQPVDGNALARRLNERVQTLAELKEVREKLHTIGVTWRKYWVAVDHGIASAAAAKIEIPPSKLATGSETLLADLDPTALADEVGRLGADTLLSWVASVRETTTAALQAELEKLPTEENTSSARKLCQAIEQAEKIRLAVTVAEASAEDAAARGRAFTTLSEALRTARQDVAKELLEEIATLVTEFYRVVHPPDADDEITGPPEIEVQRRSGGTAHVRGKFHEKPVDDPRWVYSDGHLDTVGICVYLALRRFRATRDAETDPKLMILDDIVLSIDLGHGRRLLDLLRTRFDDHQVLIFTHNGLFSDWCAEKLPGYTRKAIARWTVETGPQLGEYPSMMERIEQQIRTETSPKLLAQAVMNLMDEWLAQARFEYELSVRARRGEQYTLTDIWNPFTKRMKELESP